MDPQYVETCDPLTGICVLLSGDGSYLTDPATGQVVTSYDPAVRTAGGGLGATPAPVQPIYTENSARPVTPAPSANLDYDLIYPETAAAPSTGGDSDVEWVDDGYGGGYYRRRSYGRSYGGGYSRSYGGGYSSGGGYASGSYSGGDSEPVTPRYANNAVHPFFGGDPLIPGGPFAAQDDGFDDRQQVSVPGGATAGPFAVRAAPSPSPNYSGGVPRGGSGGGGGGVARDLYWHYANKLKGKLTGASSGYGDYQQQTFKPYRGPDDPRTARKVERLNLQEQQDASSYAVPTREMPTGVNLESPRGAFMQNLPMSDLTLLAGAGTRNWAGGIDPTEDIYDAYYKKLNHRLKAGRQGIDFLPFYRKQLRRDKSTEQFNQQLGTMYEGLASGQRIDTQELMGNLSDPRKGTFLHQQFRKAPLSQAASQFNRSFEAILGSGGYDIDQQNALAMIAQNLITQYGQQYGSRNPRRAPSLNSWVGSRLQGYMGGGRPPGAF